MTGPIEGVSAQFLATGQPAVDKSPAPARVPVFVADRRDGPDLLDTAEALQPIAQLCAHKETETPLTIGIVGPPGSGKSFALDTLVAALEAQCAAAARAPGGPFVSQIVTATIDAAGISGDPASAIAAAAFTALRRDNSGVSYAALADEAAFASADPYQAANKALERHDEVRRRLDVERQARDDVEARRARLVENMLYETAGSRIDAHARARRGQIEARLRRFDLVSGDSTANFKDLVRDLAGAGWGARLGVALNAIWAYRSQRRLLLAAFVFLALAFGLTEVQTARALDWLRGLGSPSSLAADWLAAHRDLIADVAAGLVVLGIVAAAVVLWRALLFTAMLFRGVRLLRHDVRERQRDLEAASARLNRRVAALTAETEAAGRQAEAAEKRANARGQALIVSPSPSFMESASAGPSAARAFLAALGNLLSSRAEYASASPAPAVSSRPVLGPAVPPPVQTPAASAQAVPAPERIFLAFDNLDALTPAEALNLIETAHSTLGPSFIAAFACDPAILAPAMAERAGARARLDRLFQLTFNVGLAGGSNGARLIARLLAGDGAARQSPPPVDSRQSPLSEPLSTAETRLLAALAPLAASTPRGVKRYLNAYRVARLAKASRPALALMLAVGQSADDEVAVAMTQLLTAQDRDLPDPPGPPRLAAAVRATRSAGGDALTVADAIAARDIARRYQLPA